MKRIIIALLLLLLALPLPWAVAQPPGNAVGTITFTATSAGVGATFTWGQGWLTFQGKTYPIKVEGLDVVGVGYSKIRANGKVYNLKYPQEIAGSYVQAGAGAAMAQAGAKGFLAKNDKGVVIDLSADQEGVSLNFGAGGFSITMVR